MSRRRLKALARYPYFYDHMPFQFIESFNVLGTNVKYISPHNNIRRILVTSPDIGDGKSMVALNLARALSSDETAVLLLDCDLRQSSYTKPQRTGKQSIGLTNILIGTAQYSECTIHMDMFGIDYLPSGTLILDPAKFLDSSKMKMLIDALSQQYDYIILDTPPLANVADAVILSKLTDGVLLVIRHMQTKIETVQLAKASLENVGSTVLGVVLNMFSHKNGSVRRFAETRQPEQRR